MFNPKKMIGFIMPNEKIEADITSFMVSVDSVETRTGLDFFKHLDDSVEVRLESLIQWYLLFKSPKNKRRAFISQQPFWLWINSFDMSSTFYLSFYKLSGKPTFFG